jgi:hypothetical protein
MEAQPLRRTIIVDSQGVVGHLYDKIFNGRSNRMSDATRDGSWRR